MAAACLGPRCVAWRCSLRFIPWVPTFRGQKLMFFPSPRAKAGSEFGPNTRSRTLKIGTFQIGTTGALCGWTLPRMTGFRFGVLITG